MTEHPLEAQNTIPSLDGTETLGRPDYLPEKFWDDEKSAPRIEALANSYGELEKRLGTPQDVPSSAEGYDITPPHELLQSSLEVNQRLHEAGFTKAQAQLVYDLAHEALSPMVRDIAQDMNREIEHRRLAEHFGGDDQWTHISQQLETWGRANLPPNVLDALASSYEGILALESMMESEEPRLSGSGTLPRGQESEEDLRRIMADPKYWRDRDPSLVKHVQTGFERLYPSKG